MWRIINKDAQIKMLIKMPDALIGDAPYVVHPQQTGVFNRQKYVPPQMICINDRLLQSRESRSSPEVGPPYNSTNSTYCIASVSVADTRNTNIFLDFGDATEFVKPTLGLIAAANFSLRGI